jgi:hypothetical protein
MFGETALHWTALLGADRLAARLVGGADLSLEDREYHSTQLGWAVHGYGEPPAGNIGKQLDVIRLLVAAGAAVRPEWLASAEQSGDAKLREALTARG